ncbi:hypothetical protein HYT54_02050 [Candidatus Woesearchaeota archaeon]|nr:hypothetical protein [Candidatus Woesearchaeota archaeon]
MKANIILDESAEKELRELASIEKTSKSKLIRKAINELYLKEKRARDNLLFFVDLYNDDVITKDLLFLLLPRKDAEAVIIGSETGKEGAELAKSDNS